VRPGTLAVLLAAAVAAGAFLLRTAGLSQAVFAPEPPRLISTDSWHHLRQAELLVHHFPLRCAHDAYALWPDGMESPTGPLFTYLVAASALAAGGGAPSARAVAAAAAILPPVLGALAVFVAFLLGRRFAGNAAGLIAALVTATAPGQFFQRTVLGHADHHALEALLAPLAVLLLARALGGARRPARGGVAAGLVLALYLCAWPGGALLVLALGLFGCVQVHADRFARRDPGPAAHALFAAFATAALLVLPIRRLVPGTEFALLALAGATAAVAAPLSLSGRLRRSLPLATAGMAAAAALAGVLLAPGFVSGLVHALSWFRGGGMASTVEEAVPLLYPAGEFSLSMAWRHFGFALPLSLPGFAVVGRRYLRAGRAPDGLLLVWSSAMLLATLGQNRFGYYSTLNAGLLTSAALGPWLGRLWRREGPSPVPVLIGRVLWPAAVAVALSVPRGPAALALGQFHPGPRDAWVDAMTWLRDSTPEPFGDEGRFFARARPGEGPRPAYSVLCWWDAGYWVTQIGRRVPLANPTQAGAVEAARILVEGTPERALALCRDHGVRYVVLSGEIPVLPAGPGALRGDIPEIAKWAGLEPEVLLGTCWRRDEGGEARALALFLPAYYRTLAVRLFVFGGRAAAPEGPVLVAAWRVVDGRKEIVSIESFDTFEVAAARAGVLGRGASVVSDDPLRTCVPLEELPVFRRVYASPEAAAIRFPEPIPEVQVFEVAADYSVSR
jgi:dolichyl-diphosphooligosaccharide--protein glycosyltransferase